MTTLSPEMEDIGRKIERLTLEPESISAPFTRLFRPLLHRIGWRPKASVESLRALVAQIQWVRRSRGNVEDCRKLLDAARSELRDNISQVERATVINRRPLVAHAAWLRRLYELVAHAELAVSTASAGALALAATGDDARMLPPLAMGKAKPAEHEKASPEEPEGEARGEGDDGSEPTPEPFADPTRVLELQLDTIDHLMAAAREEDALLGRRRRLLDTARQLLLETAAALALEENGVQQRLQSIAQQITRINRYQAVGLLPDVALMHQARTALSRGERDKLFAALSVMQRSAVDRGDLSTTSITTDAIERLTTQYAAPAAEDQQRHSLGRSAQEIFGERVVEAISEGYRKGRRYERNDDEANTDRWVAKQVKDYFAPGSERDTLAHILSVDGCFEVGGVLSPVRIQEHYVRHRVVPYPTQRLNLVQARGPQDLATAVITDPRTVLMDLATGRLLARRYVKEEIASRTRTLMQGEVRVYLLDGSSSMLGARARMRDSILIAELATLLTRLENPDEHTRVVLHYRYFNSALGPVTRVDTPGGVIEAIAEVTGTPRTGGTDIEGALISSLELIAEAQRSDSELARAQIVLITDGVANVREEAINEARQALGDLPVGVSVIALGEENPALRQVVAHQRAQHERAFYHYLPDDYLERLASAEVGDDGIHLPSVPKAKLDPTALEDQLGSLLDDLAALSRSREAKSLQELDRIDRERRLERSDVEAVGEGERARLEALYRDDRALLRRYQRWFPTPLVVADVASAQQQTIARAQPAEGTLEHDDLDSMMVVLASIAEVVEAAGSTLLGRQADAIDLLERLLPDARLTPARYHELLRSYPVELAPGLDAVHGAVKAGLGWRIEYGRRYGQNQGMH